MTSQFLKLTVEESGTVTETRKYPDGRTSEANFPSLDFWVLDYVRKMMKTSDSLETPPTERSTKRKRSTTAQERFTFHGTASEIARQVAIKANLPQLLHAADAVEWDDYEHSIRGKTLTEALTWLSLSWPALEAAINAASHTEKK